MAAAKKKKRNKDKKNRLRILPIIIFIGVVMLSLRLNNLVQWIVASSTAETGRVRIEQKSLEPAIAQNASPTSAPENLRAANAAEQDNTNSFLGKFELDSMNTNLGNPKETQCDAPTFTRTELEVLQKLATRREKLDHREHELEMKMTILSAAQKQIDRKVSKLKELQSTIEKLLQKHSEQEQKKLDDLAKMYATMRPKDAAKIFNKLDLPVLITVVENMKATKSGAIVAYMDADKAKELTAALTERRKLPLPGTITSLENN